MEKKKKDEPIEIKENAVQNDEAEQEISELEAALNELEKTNGQLLRVAAEYDNFRKRASKEKIDAYTNAKRDSVEKLLPVLDNFERAFQNEGASEAEYKKGIHMIFNQFEDVLAELGVEKFGQVGDVFDPTLHDAVMHIDDENFGENTVADVFAYGYKIGDKIVRCATVKVAN